MRIRRLHVANERSSEDLIQRVTASCERTAGTYMRRACVRVSPVSSRTSLERRTHKVVARALDLQGAHARVSSLRRRQNGEKRRTSARAPCKCCSRPP